MLDRIAESFPDLGVEIGIEIESAIKILGRKLPVFLVIFSEPTVKEKEGRIAILWQAAQEFVVFPEVEVGVQDGPVISFQERINQPRTLALRNRFVQHAGESIRISQLPMGWCIVRVGFKGGSQQWHRLLHLAC